MARVLFAWELGANYGHLTTDLPVAEALRSSGYEVHFAVPDLRLAAALLEPAGFPFRAAPRLPTPEGPLRAPVSYAEILLASGFENEAFIVRLVQDWLRTIDELRPDALVIDHAPAALTAAVASDTPAILLGSGFTMPPDVSPLPSIRPWEAVSTERRQRADSLALSRINRALALGNRPPLRRLVDLFAGHPALITTFAELDPYGPRAACDYLGPLDAENKGLSAQWQTSSGRRIFAYLHAATPGIDAVLMALEECGAEVICIVPGASEALMKHFEPTRVRLLDQRVPLEPLLRGADQVVTHGGQGLIASALASGVPLLLIPHAVEQYLSALQVRKLGAGVVLDIDRRERRQVAQALGELLDREEYRRAAHSFALRHEGFDRRGAARKAAERIAEYAHERGKGHA